MSDDDVHQELAGLVQSRGWAFATAESVTAGLVADRAAQGDDASAWLDKVASVTRASGDGELASTKPGQFLCVAYITGSGVGTKREESLGGLALCGLVRDQPGGH